MYIPEVRSFAVGLLLSPSVHVYPVDESPMELVYVRTVCENSV
jgi:hypothetical protein